jgi:hypothetical protein
MKRTLARGALLVSVVMLTVSALPSAAWAEADYYVDCWRSYVSCQTGVKVSAPQGAGDCATSGASKGMTSVCVVYDGDYVYVRDGKVDDRAAFGMVWSANGVRDRYCLNNHGYDTWARCNFDWAEDGDHTVTGGYKESYYDLVWDGLWTWSGKLWWRARGDRLRARGPASSPPRCERSMDSTSGARWLRRSA